MAHDRRFRFGVQTGGATSAQKWKEKARKIEALGYSTLYMPDHFVDTPYAPIVGIAMAAAGAARSVKAAALAGAAVGVA